MTSDDLQSILSEASALLDDNQKNVTPEIINLVEQEVLPLFQTGTRQTTVTRLMTMNTIDLQNIGMALAAFVTHEKTLLIPDPTTHVTMTSKIIGMISKIKARTWIVAVLAKLF